jgi:hypothetical protein
MKIQDLMKSKPQTSKLTEGLAFEDLRGLISNKISIDQYKPKIGAEEETVVLAFTVTYEEPAEDLANFIETGHLEHLDVDTSGAPETDGSYRVFVEFQRDHDLYEKIEQLLASIDQITSKEEDNWEYIAFGNGGKSKPVNHDNIRADISNSKSEYRMKYSDPGDADSDEVVATPDEVEESINRLKKLVTY